MKENVKKLNRILSIFDADLFYDIYFTKSSIHLQGEHSIELMKQISRIDWSWTRTGSNGFLEYSKYNVNIVVT